MEFGLYCMCPYWILPAFRVFPPFISWDGGYSHILPGTRSLEYRGFPIFICYKRIKAHTSTFDQIYPANEYSIISCYRKYSSPTVTLLSAWINFNKLWNLKDEFSLLAQRRLWNVINIKSSHLIQGSISGICLCRLLLPFKIPSYFFSSPFRLALINQKIFPSLNRSDVPLLVLLVVT